MKKLMILLTLLLVGGIATEAADKKKKSAKKPTAKAKKAPKAKVHPTGYTDTPFLPGQKWRVHDDARPRPSVVTPGGRFSDMAPPPSDAIVLFDGTDLSKFENQKTGGPAAWKVENGYMEVAPRTGTIQTKDKFGDFQLHIEFATPTKVEGHSQGRGNSGVIVYGMYEIQVLDSYNNKSYADGQAGALYGQYPPLFNAARKPGAWQTYDIIFETARWDKDGRLTKKTSVTVIHNGVVLHNRKEYIGAVSHRRVGNYNTPHPPEGPIVLQDHGNPTRFRNIWLRPLGEYDANDKK